MPELSRRDFIRGAAAGGTAAIVAPATPLWAQWLRDEMRRFAGRRFWVPSGAEFGADGNAMLRLLHRMEMHGPLKLETYPGGPLIEATPEDVLAVIPRDEFVPNGGNVRFQMPGHPVVRAALQGVDGERCDVRELDWDRAAIEVIS